MEDNRGQRRQNDPPTHSTSSPQYQQSPYGQPQQRHSFAGTHGDGFRPAPLGTLALGTARGIGGSATYNTYYQEATAAVFSGISQGSISYHSNPTDYRQADTRQPQSFGGGYNLMLYNLPQPAGSQSTAVYDTSQQFPLRQPASTQRIMATDIAGPYFPGDTDRTATASSLQAQTGSSGVSQVYQQQNLQIYPTGGMTAMGGMATQSSATRDVRMEEEYLAAEGGLDATYASYQSALKTIFQKIQDGSLATASETLLSVSDWLLSHVAELGLTSDDQNLHSDRIKLWNDFNNAWLAILQAQKDMMEPKKQLELSRSLIPQDGLERMGKELVRLCDSIERHGLVDYEYGVWEERIIAILEECLDLYGT
ncbi:hypothetical protein QBC47DRAFT_453170 [Echria macrotheca]|uniref:Uncharacterized protein n=1 Tax=Echria macrotheca TaxID=438768 RepID=A0AAJ0FAE4_9PEZI|nr:hypothetical protein QBC47DRAFT_453170 [Echria macrotheca]